MANIHVLKPGLTFEVRPVEGEVDVFRDRLLVARIDRATFDTLIELVPEPLPESPYQRAARLQSEAIAAAHEALGDLADRGMQVKAILESVFGRKG